MWNLPPTAKCVGRWPLRDMTLKTKNLGVDEFDLQQLKELCIDVDPITLDETSPHKPSYFALYPGNLIPEPTDDALEGPYNGLNDETEDSFTRPVDRTYVMNIYLSFYIFYCDRNAKGERVPCTSKE